MVKLDDKKKKEIQKDLKALIQKHGVNETKQVCFKYFRDLKDKAKLMVEIKKKETELEKLKKQL